MFQTRLPLALGFALALCACGKGNNNNNNACLAPETQSCQTHADCNSDERGCAFQAALCDYTSHKCTGDMIAYNDDKATTPRTQQLDCFANPPAAGTPQQIRVRGCIESFGLDADTRPGLSVTFYKLSDLSTPLLVLPSQPDSDIYTDGTTCKYKGGFDTNSATGSVKTLPSDTVLVAKVSDTSTAKTFVDTWSWNRVYQLASGQTEVKNAKVNAILKQTYQLIPGYAGLSSIPAGHGAIAGSVQDCGGYALGDAVVTFAGISPRRTLYFNGVSDNENPQASRLATNLDGIFAAVDVAPGTGTVTAAAKQTQGTKTFQFPTFSLTTFADSVTIVDVSGPLPK